MRNLLLTTTLVLTAVPALAVEYPQSQAPMEVAAVDPQRQVQSWPAANPGSPSAPSDAAASNVTPVARDGEIINSLGAGAIPALPLTVMEAPNGIRYVTGGIGDEEEAQLKSLERDFNAQLLMTGLNGEYLSGAHVRVLDKAGNEVLVVNNAGPYLYTKLPAGTYTFEVTARQGGIKKTTMNVPATSAARQQLRFAEV